MRVLATIGFSFSAGVFLAALLPWDGWQLYAAAGAALLALVWLLAARRSTCFRRGLLILLPLAVSLAYFAGYQHLVQRPVEQASGEQARTEETVEMVPEERQIPLSQRVPDLVITVGADLTAITVRPWAKSMC